MGKKEFILALARGARGKDAAKALVLPDFIGAVSSPMGKETLSLTAFAAPTLKVVTKKSKVTSCTVSFTPSQDLHGYDSPWPSGGGKNLLKPYADGATKTNVGITATANADGSITFSGTATGTFWGISDSPDFTLKAGTYTFSQSEMVPGLTTTLCKRVGSTTTAITAVDDTLYKTFTTSEDLTVYFYNKISSGTVFSSPMTMRFQLESGNQSTSWTPYTNLCPITGWQGAEVYIEPTYDPTATPKASVTFGVVGKNLYNPATATENKWLNATTGEAESANGYYVSDYIKIEPSTDYYKTAVGSTRQCYYKEDKTFLKSSGWGGGSASTSPEGAYYARFTGKTSTIAYDGQIMYEKGSSASAYEPYRDNILGGTAEIVAGTGSETYKEVVFDGSNDEQWSVYSGKRVTVTVSDYTAPSNSTVSPIKANYLKTVAKTSQGEKSGLISGSDGGDHAIMINIGLSSVSDVRAYLAENPLQVSYPLTESTPFTFPPASSELILQKGDNYNWAEMTND